jgi:uncharacterized membrane-anchored protein YjiN (DUF445 family)
MKKPLGLDYKLKAAEARERIAEKMLDVEAVYGRIKDAVTAGHDSVRITHRAHPVDLSHTKFAAGLVKRLKADCFMLDWEKAVYKVMETDEHGRQFETGELKRYRELVISWGE